MVEWPGPPNLAVTAMPNAASGFQFSDDIITPIIECMVIAAAVVGIEKWVR